MDTHSNAPGRILLIASGIAHAILGFFFIFYTLSPRMRLSPFFSPTLFIIYGAQFIIGILGILFSRALSVSKCLSLIILSGLQLLFYVYILFSGLNFILVIELCATICLFIGALRNLLASRE